MSSLTMRTNPATLGGAQALTLPRGSTTSEYSTRWGSDDWYWDYYNITFNDGTFFDCHSLRLTSGFNLYDHIETKGWGRTEQCFNNRRIKSPPGRKTYNGMQFREENCVVE